MPLAPELMDALARHAALEQGNGLTYQALYQAARADSFEGFAKRWKNDAMDEFGHAQNWLKFIARYNERVPYLGAITPAEAGLGVVEMCIAAAEAERRTEDSMRGVLATAEAIGDGAAVEWVSGKLVEQQKERKQADDFAARVVAAAAEPGSLTLIDRMLERGEWK